MQLSVVNGQFNAGGASMSGLCEACGMRRRTEAAIAEAGLVAAT
ncbi:hypothetical protein ACIRVK_43045 [Streptomyces sp. NPDC101152]